MAKDFARSFYKSTSWRKCRANYLKTVGGLCELCLKEGKYEPAVIVHHKIVLSEKNIHDPEVTLSFKNLTAVCAFHHALIHDNKQFLPNDIAPKRYEIDQDGHVLIIAD